MRLILRLFKISLFAVLSVVVVAVLYSTFDKEIEAAYSKAFWKLPTEIASISTADEKSDVFFKLGKYKSECNKKNNACIWEIDEIFGEGLIVYFNEDAVETINKRSTSMWGLNEIPFTDVQTMKNILGEPFIYAESKDFLTRRYTYMQDIKLKTGVSFSFSSDKLESYMIGDVEWRKTGITGKYMIGGETVCPGDDCPEDSDGNIRQGFKDKDFTYFINN